IRDTMLQAAGRLDPTPGGPAFVELTRPRRSLYVQTCRWDRSNFATQFDAANPDASVERRAVSTVAPQALTLLNHEFARAQATALAERLLRESAGDDAARIERAYQLLFARRARPEEVALCRGLLIPRGPQKSEARWQDLAHVLLCSNEFAYLE
ncbi:MAG: DUF1553 domain-containing protein, partial [Armatimonadetes bacterium]|nr:DUF1553 domain-containing protein [Armatimonadota bacterium]